MIALEKVLLWRLEKIYLTLKTMVCLYTVLLVEYFVCCQRDSTGVIGVGTGEQSVRLGNQ